MRTQKVVAEGLNDLWPHSESAGSGRSGRDVLGTPGVAIEVKARTGLDLPAWMRQAAKEAATTGDLPVLIIRPNGMGEASLDDWPVVMSFKLWKEVMRDAGFGSTDGQGV